MDAGTLIELVERWTRLLGISDWTIEVRTCMPYEMPEGFEGNSGACCTNPDSRRAEIALALPATLGDRELNCNECDIEATLVHELLHVLLTDCGVPLEGHPERLVYTLEHVLTGLGRTGLKVDPFAVERMHLRYEPWVPQWVDLAAEGGGR